MSFFYTAVIECQFNSIDTAWMVGLAYMRNDIIRAGGICSWVGGGVGAEKCN